MKSSLVCEAMEISEQLNDCIESLWSPAAMTIHDFKQQQLEKIFQERHASAKQIKQYVSPQCVHSLCNVLLTSHILRHPSFNNARFFCSCMHEMLIFWLITQSVFGKKVCGSQR